MAIMLDEAVEAKVADIARRTGLRPDEVIARAVENEEKRLEGEREARRKRRQEAERELRAELPTLTDADRRRIDQVVEDMYDEDGLPKY